MFRKNPGLKKMLRNKKFSRLLSYASGRIERPMFFIQQIRNSHADGGKDPQKFFHSDTFHPTMKMWLFLEDVPLEKGAFNYVPGSNRLTPKRIKWEYNKSINGKKLKDGYSEKGSLRVSQDELKDLGLGEVKEFAVKKNTLVIGNTHGFHRRGLAQPGATRLEIYASSRVNPFSPFIGFGSLATLRDVVLKKYLARQDAKSAKKGTKASWHKAPAGII
jgi:hypothetical protein